jgi:hypothetical protein
LGTVSSSRSVLRTSHTAFICAQGEGTRGLHTGNRGSRTWPTRRPRLRHATRLRAAGRDGGPGPARRGRRRRVQRRRRVPTLGPACAPVAAALAAALTRELPPAAIRVPSSLRPQQALLPRPPASCWLCHRLGRATAACTVPRPPPPNSRPHAHHPGIPGIAGRGSR